MIEASIKELIKLNPSVFEDIKIQEGMPYLRQLVELAAMIGEALEAVHAHSRSTGKDLPNTLSQSMQQYFSGVASLNLDRDAGTTLFDGSWERLAVLVSAKARFRREVRVQFNAISKLIREKHGQPGFKIEKEFGADLDILIELAENLDKLIEGLCDIKDGHASSVNIEEKE